MSHIAILGLGNWGTALAKTWLDAKHEISGWTIETEVYESITSKSINEKYLKQANYTNLNYFRDREKIGLILENENNIEDKLKQLSHEKQNFKKSILEIRNKISYLDSSKEWIRDTVEPILIQH